MKITFGEWLPDQPGVTGAVMEAVNCYPVTNGYAPLRDAADYSDNAGETLLIAFAGKSAGSSTLFAASATSIYKFDSSDASLDAVKTTYSAVESWDVTQYGSKLILANGADKLQYWDLGGSTTVSDLSAAAPTAKYVTVVRDFVVVANTYESAAQQQYRVRWSAINNETDWTEDVNTQSDYQDIPDGGQIMGIRGGEFGLVLLERSIHRMTYVGTPFI